VRHRRPLTLLAGAGIAFGLHIVLLYALLQLDSVHSAVIAAVPITVSLITPANPAVRETRPIPPKRQRQVQPPKPAPTPPVITAAADARAELVASPPSPLAPLPPIDTPAPLLAAPAAEAVVAAPAPLATAPAPLTPPSFDAAYLNNPAPAYPALSRRMGEEGRVVLRVHVSEDGMPTQVQLKTSSKYARLDEAALEAVRRWRFVPARRADAPVAAWVLVPISFSLRG
jgi:protein TonB